MYIAFVILHVICAGIWISLMPLSMSLGKLIKRSAGTLGELYLMRAMLGAGRFLGNIGGIGILITGGAITSIGKYGWFPFNTFPWLAYKQTIFFLILIMLFSMFVPASKRAAKMLAEEMGGPKANMGASTELRAAMAKVGTLGMIMGIFVLVNIILGESKLVF